MKKLKEIAGGLFYYLMARLARFLFMVLDKRGSLNVAMISNYRDEIDIKNFGFGLSQRLPDVLSWTRYIWEGRKARLFMIGSRTEDITGDKATSEKIQRACAQFEQAVGRAVALGAQVILYGAATKRLPIWREMRAKYPEVNFTLGDNFAGLMLCEGIKLAFERSGLSCNSRVLITAPYGFLGTAALRCVLSLGVVVGLLGSPERIVLLRGLRKKYNIDIATSFEEVGMVDAVVACDSSPRFQLSPDRVRGLCRPVSKKGWSRRRLIVVDPCAPPAMSPQAYEKVKEDVLRLDAGNAFSARLKYVGGPIGPWLLRLNRGTVWGCFAETFLIDAHPEELRPNDWFKISEENAEAVRIFYGKESGQFDLPAPVCFSTPVADFKMADRQLFHLPFGVPPSVPPSAAKR